MNHDGYHIRPFRGEDEPQIILLWNTCVHCDSIVLADFRRMILLDPNFDGRGCLVAVSGETIIGFINSLRRRYPYYDAGLEQGRGWITMFFVDPLWRRKSVATALFQHAEAFLREVSVKEIYVSNYTPHYFVPGVDCDAHAEALEFLKIHGYVKHLAVYSMGRSLEDFSLPADLTKHERRLQAAGVSVRIFHPALIAQTMEFLRGHYPGDLFRVAIERLTEKPDCDEIFVAMKDEAVIGFCHFLGDHFGPFGIHPGYMGRGIGPLMYYRTVEQMLRKGRKKLWLAWTTGKAKDFYHKVGLTVLRRHIIMKKNLGEIT